MSRVPAWAQVIHLPEEEFLDAEADDVTVCDPVERNAEPQAFLILVNPVTGQASDVDHILGGVENPITALRPFLHHLLDSVFTCRGRGFGQRASGRGFPSDPSLALEGLDLHQKVTDRSVEVPGGRADSFRAPLLQRLG